MAPPAPPAPTSPSQSLPPRRRAARLTRATRPSVDDGLSRERIIGAAILLLDSEGERGLTFRALAAHLTTGAGALYWHIDNKEALIAAASDALIAAALREVPPHSLPRRAIRAIAAGVFAVIDAHPWLGALLSHGPWQGATMELFEHVGRQLQAMQLSEGIQFTAASTLVGYILGVSHQNAANGRGLPPGTERAELLTAEAARWSALDPEAYPFTRAMATRLDKHDDLAEFLAGIDLILDGLEAGASARPAAS